MHKTLGAYSFNFIFELFTSRFFEYFFALCKPLIKIHLLSNIEFHLTSLFVFIMELKALKARSHSHSYKCTKYILSRYDVRFLGG